MSCLSLRMAHAGIAGSVEVVLQNDNRIGYARNTLQEWLDFQYRNEARLFDAGLSFALYHSDDGNQAEIHQLYIKHRFHRHAVAVGLGRLQRTDALGFYYLDGINVEASGTGWSANAYAGIPGRIDDYRGIEAKSLLGVDIEMRADHPRWHMLDKLQARFGWQQYTDGETENRINAALRAVSRSSGLRTTLTDMLVQGTWVMETARFADLQAFIHGRIAARTDVQLGYESYRPGRDYLTFRDRFYSGYSRGDQHSWRLAIEYRLDDRASLQARARKIDRATGQRGHGGSLGVSLRTTRQRQWLIQLDQLKFQDDSSDSLFVEMNTALSATGRITFGLVLQQQYRSLYGDNRVMGVETRYEHMASARLYWNFMASYLANTRLRDEHRLGARLSYRFDDGQFRPAGREER